jgi:hypothetical protein
MLAEHYWKEFYRLKVQVTFLELLMARNERIDRTIKIVLAIASSASIGAWAVFKTYAFVWALIIALSQVLTAIRPFLPFKDRLRTISGLMLEFDDLLLHVESRWLEISQGELTEGEIRKSLNDLRGQRQKALKKFFGDRALPQDTDLFRKAEQRANMYIQHFYGAPQEAS